MRVPVWVKPLATTLGVAAAAGAAQLGIAYGLAVLLWTKDFGASADIAWPANLTWVCWLSASSVVIGAIAGGQVTRSAGLPDSAWLQVVIAAVAAVGTLVTVPLAAIPARYAQLASDPDPATTAARIAVLGVLLGAVVAVGVLLGKPLAWNAIATTGWLWLVALISVVVALITGTEPDATRLGIWSIGESSPGWFLVMAPMLLAALALGAGIAWLAKQQGLNRVAVAVCGAPGPLLLAVAYLVAGPGTRPETGEQFLPYLAAPYAVLTGLLGSLLVSAIDRPLAEESAGTPDAAASETAAPDAAVPEAPVPEAPAPDGAAEETAMLPRVESAPDEPEPYDFRGEIESGPAATEPEPGMSTAEPWEPASTSTDPEPWEPAPASPDPQPWEAASASPWSDVDGPPLNAPAWRVADPESASPVPAEPMPLPPPAPHPELPAPHQEWPAPHHERPLTQHEQPSPRHERPSPRPKPAPHPEPAELAPSPEPAASPEPEPEPSPEPSPEQPRKRRFRFGRHSAPAPDTTATQALPTVEPAPSAPDPQPEAQTADEPSPSAAEPAPDHPEWAEEERWLEQIKGDDEPVRGATFRPAPTPRPERPERRKWSLFGDDDDPDFPTAEPPTRS
ncbi:MAG: hypothetical protein ACRDTM_01490 [Micromonosporaceae bacterium]